MRNYLTTLITEKGKSTDDLINLEGHHGLTYDMLIKFIETQKTYHAQIKKTIVQIDFANGDVFHYLKHLALGMVKSVGY